MSSQRPIIIIGGGGHASVLVEMLGLLKHEIKGFVCPNPSTIKNYPHVQYLGDDTQVSQFAPHEVKLVNGIGAISVEKNSERNRIYQQYKDLGYEFETLVHPLAYVASTAVLNEGVQVMAGAIVQANAVISSNSIINTRSSIDHDCLIGQSVHIAPGVTLSGGVEIGHGAFVGAGAIIIQAIKVPAETLVRAGRVVVKDILE